MPVFGGERYRTVIEGYVTVTLQGAKQLKVVVGVTDLSTGWEARGEFFPVEGSGVRTPDSASSSGSRQA